MTTSSLYSFIPKANAIRPLCAFLLVSFVFMAPVIAAPAENYHIITLTNGDRLTAIIKNRTEEKVTLVLQAGPEFSLNTDKITSLKPLSSINQDVDAPELQKAGPDKKKKEKSSEQIMAYSGRVELGGELQTGNSDTQSLILDFELMLRHLKNRYKMEFDYNRSEEEDIVTDDTVQLGLNYDRFLNERWFVGGGLDFEKDDVARLDLRTRAGLKIGYQFYEAKDLSLSVSAGSEVIREEFEAQDTKTDLAFSQSINYEQKFFQKALTLFYDHDFLVPYGETSAFIYEGETGLRVPLVENFIASASADIDWDNDSAPGTSEEDITYTLKLGYEF